MRRPLAALAACLAVLVPLAPAAAQDRPRVVDGTWFLTFTPTSYRSVGTPIDRDQLECGIPGPCQASYQFEDPDAPGLSLRTHVTFDAAGCAASPCTFRIAPPDATRPGFRASVTFDGTAYRATGDGFYATAQECAEHLPDGLDSLTFTVGGTPAAPELTGEMTALLAVVGPSSDDGTCTDVLGYEIYTGRVAGTPANPRSAFAGDVDTGRVPDTIGRAGGATAARLADERAAREHTRPVLSTRVATARDVPWGLGAVAVSALLALLLVVLMPFPAALFNATLEEHYAEVRGWFRLPWRRGAAEPAEAAAPRATWPRFVLLVGSVAVLGALLDPGLGLDTASLVLVAGLAVAAVVVSLLGALPARLYVGRRYAEPARLALYPLGLGVAAFCVLVSRVTSFEPGYLYGVVAGFGFARELRTDEKGRLSLATSAGLLVVSGAAFALRLPVHDAVVEGGGVALTLLDTVLAAVFAAGVEANVLGLLPLRFLPGEPVYRWSRLAWGGLFGLNVFAFLHTLSAAAGQASTGTSVVVAAALFGAFATVSVAFWAYFRLRRDNPTPVSV